MSRAEHYAEMAAIVVIVVLAVLIL